MAEERNLATARAPEAAEGEAADPTKAELQRRMEEARESITQTVHEIKETVSSQYQNVRETISQSLDWREQYRRRPLAFTAGAVGVGALLGYSVGGALFGGDSDDLAGRYYEAEGDYDDDDVSVSASGASAHSSPSAASGAYGSTAYPRAGHSSADTAAEAFDRGIGRQQEEGASYGAERQSDGRTYQAAPLASAAPRPSYSSGYESSPAASAESAPEEPKGPSLFERFKETQAYDRLQGELQNLGNRAVEELSKTAQQVVLPALLGKLKDLIGIDLSTQREVAQRSRLEQQAAHASAQVEQAGQSAGGGGTQSGAGTGSGAYGGYGKTL